MPVRRQMLKPINAAGGNLLDITVYMHKRRPGQGVAPVVGESGCGAGLLAEINTTACLRAALRTTPVRSRAQRAPRQGAYAQSLMAFCLVLRAYHEITVPFLWGSQSWLQPAWARWKARAPARMAFPLRPGASPQWGRSFLT